MSRSAALMRRDQPVNLIVPYRQRWPQLDHLIKQMTKYYPKYHLVVVEQQDRGLFQKTWLINMGLSYYNRLANIGSEKSDYNTVIVHDVDVAPKRYCPMYQLKDITSTVHQIYGGGFQLPSGGIVCFPRDILNRINGYSRYYPGWGSEDTDLTYRLYFRERKPILKSCRYRITQDVDGLYWNKHQKFHQERGFFKESKEGHQNAKYLADKAATMGRNDCQLTEQVINYNLSHYYRFSKDFLVEYADKDADTDSSKITKDDGRIFFKGRVSPTGVPVEGKLYDLLLQSGVYRNIVPKLPGLPPGDHEYFPPGLPIYSGQFRHGLPGGQGQGYHLWGPVNPLLTGRWRNGYFWGQGDSLKDVWPKSLRCQRLSFQQGLSLDVSDFDDESTDWSTYYDFVWSGAAETNNDQTISDVLVQKINPNVTWLRAPLNC